MYDRAPRQVSDQLVGSTSAAVGPGTYELPKHSKKDQTTTGYAPFLSLANRTTLFNVPEQEVDDPGPGTYNPSLPQQHVKGGGTLANKERRFTDSEIIKENTPGPGRYNLKGGFNKEAEEQLANKTKTATLDENENIMVDVSITKSGRPQKILTATLRSDVNSAFIPSIPSPGQAHGYIEKTGILGLLKQTGAKKDTTMGPAYYSVDHDETKATKKYKGVHFGSMTSQRTSRKQFKGKEGPAPCDYETLTNQGWGKDAEKIGTVTGKVFESRLPRYHQLVQIDEKKRGVPGPGRYDMASQFQDGYMSEKAIESQKLRPAFGLQQNRFLGNDKKTPAPGSYNDPRNALEALKKISGLKRSPFGQTSIRFKPDRSRSVMLNNTPGPGSYNILNYGMSVDSQKRAKKASKHGGFGSTSVRTKSMIERDAKDTPGPGLYELRNTFKMQPQTGAAGQDQPKSAQQQQNPEAYKNHMTSSFASHTARLDAPTTRTKLENPPPGSYEVAFSYEKTQNRSCNSSSKPRNKQAYLRQRSFLSSAPRFGKMNVYMPGQLPVDPEIGVSSASYEPKGQVGKTKLALIASKDERFKEAMFKNPNPGPGTYHLSPLIDSTVLKGTYNVTLNNPVPQKAKDVKAKHTGTRPHTTPGVVAVS